LTLLVALDMRLIADEEGRLQLIQLIQLRSFETYSWRRYQHI